MTNLVNLTHLQLAPNPNLTHRQPMPDVLEAPRVIGRPFQPGNPLAKAGAAASVASRTAKRTAHLSIPATPINSSAQMPQDAAGTAVQQQLSLAKEQIARTRKVLNSNDGYCEHCERGGIEPHHRAQLLKALDTLAKWERSLLKIGDPAPVKAGSREPRGQTLAAWQPVPAAVAPVLHVQQQPEANPSGQAPNAVDPTV